MSIARTLPLMALAGVLLAGFAATAGAQDDIAAMSPEQLVEARQAAMREDGGILRSLGSLTGAEAVAAADVLIANFSKFPALFAEGSIVGDSKALPVIWEEKEAFDALFEQSVTHSQELKAALEAGDAAAAGAAMQAIGGLCGQCHQKYRS